MWSIQTEYHRIAEDRLRGLAVLAFLLICTIPSLSLAQSGRTANQSSTKPAETKSSPVEKSDDKKSLAPAFMVVTAAPDSFQKNYPVSSSQSTNLEYQARGACVIELKKLPGAKVIEDEDVSRWEAREAALAEDDVWVIWMELRWDKTISPRDSSPFRLRYLLFEPGTGRIAASGTGNSVTQTWGVPQEWHTSLEDLLRGAGRDVARQVVTEVATRH